MDAKKIDDLKVVLGQMIKVQNQDKKKFQNNDYIAIQVEDENGDNECCLLFTQIELSDMPKISSKLLEQNMIVGRLYSFIIGNKKSFIVILINRNGQKKIYRISGKKLNIAYKRALNNPQDLTKKSLLTDMFD